MMNKRQNNLNHNSPWCDNRAAAGFFYFFFFTTVHPGTVI